MGDRISSRNSRLLLIRIRPSRDGSASSDSELALEAEALVDQQSIYPSAPFTVDLNELQAAIMSGGNRYGQVLGSQLCSAVSIQRAMAAMGQPETLRVQLMLEGCGPHEAIRWERLAVPARAGEALALRRDTPFSRFAAVDLPQDAAPEDARFHLLVAVASPLEEEVARFEVGTIDAQGECLAIVEACEDLLKSGQMQLTLLPGKRGFTSPMETLAGIPRVRVVDGFATAQHIASLLGDVNGLHVIAHGRRGRQFNLILEDENLGMLACPDAQLIEGWRPERLRLIFLQSCQSAAARTANDPRPLVNSFMQQLVRAGASAVVAMQDFVRMEDAKKFNHGFYTSLIREGLVDEAANEGRRRLRQTVDAAWSIPAVTTRLKEGAVWRESPLRVAQKRLRDRMQEEQKVRYYPMFPVDVAVVTSDDLVKRSNDPSLDDIETAYPSGEGVRVDALRTLTESVSLRKPGEIICLIGAHGRAKTTLVEALYLSEIERHWRGEQPAMPVLLRLADCVHAGFNPERTFARAIAKFFEMRAGAELDEFYLSDCFDQQDFLFLLSGDEDLSDTTLQAALRALANFRERRHGPNADPHRYVVTLDQSSIKVADVPPNSNCLIVEPMSVERVTFYLQAFPSTKANHNAGKILLKRLTEGLWDLAEVPWLLSEMLDQADRGVLGETRAAILKRVADERIGRMVGPTGIRTRVEEALYRLAWDMYYSRKTSMAGTDVFQLLTTLRGNRDYSLVDFRAQLIHQCRMMAPGNEDGLRFAYPGFRSYCCAQYIFRQSDEVRSALLEEITATLGRRSRAQLWEEVLVILAGLWEETGALLRMILSGVALGEGDQIYIAARCLQEARQAFPNSSEGPMVRSLVSSLIYRSHPRSFRSVSARRKAIQFLGPLKEPQGLAHLITLALRKIRPDAKNKFTFDYSGVRLAAIKALLYTPAEVLKYVRQDPEWSQNERLHDTLGAWLAFDCERMRTQLHECNDVAVASVAAFGLSLTKLEGAYAALAEKFLATDHMMRENGGDLLWAVTDALLEMGDPELMRLISRNLDREDLRHPMAYLIGKLGMAAPGSVEYKFLERHLDGDDTVLRGRCLQALAELRETSVLPLCHKWLDERNPVFRYYALQSVRQIGTEETLSLLTEACKPAENQSHGSFSIERLRLEVYEDIYWRLAGGKSREVMTPILKDRG